MEATAPFTARTDDEILAELVDEYMTAGLAGPLFSRMLRVARRLTRRYGFDSTPELLATVADNLGHDGDTIRTAWA